LRRAKYSRSLNSSFDAVLEMKSDNLSAKEGPAMNKYPISKFLFLFFAIAVLPGQHKLVDAQENAKMTEAEAKMFSAAAGYERFMGRWSRQLAPEFIAFARVKNGDRILDVGSGTGSLASALETSMPSSEILGIDPSQGFISYAKKNAKSGRTQFKIGDAQALRFQNGSFDQTMALLVMNFIPDHNKAIDEMRRVTRPRGGVSACVWDYDKGMQMLRFFWDEAIALDPAIEPKDERHMKLSRQGELGKLWKRAGLVSVQEKLLTIDQPYESFDHYWGPFLRGAGPGGAYVVSLSNEKRHELETRIRKRLLGNRKDAPFVLKARAWCVRGEVPKSG
jgi:ubiquinone/menaquinone biosynthesis C-methylase UbiE